MKPQLCFLLIVVYCAMSYESIVTVAMYVFGLYSKIENIVTEFSFVCYVESYRWYAIVSLPWAYSLYIILLSI